MNSEAHNIRAKDFSPLQTADHSPSSNKGTYVGANNHSPSPQNTHSPLQPENPSPNVSSENTSPKKHRQPTRLRDFDYTQTGGYFITICTHNRICLFGDIVADKVHLTAMGAMVAQCWQEIPLHFPHVALQEFVVMPNHVHGIISIDTDGCKPAVGANNYSPVSSQSHHSSTRPQGTAKTLGSIIRGFKIGVTKWARAQKGEMPEVESQSGKSKAGERFFAPTKGIAVTSRNGGWRTPQLISATQDDKHRN